MIVTVSKTKKMVKVAIVEKRSNGDVEYKVLDRIDDDMRWLKWSVMILLGE